MSEPEPQDRSSAGERVTHDPVSSPDEGGALVGLAGPLCLVLLAGLAVPPGYGLVLPLVVAAVLTVVAQRRVAALRGMARAFGPEINPVVRGMLSFAALLAVALLMTVLARGVGLLLVDVPAASWGGVALLGVGLLWGVVGRWLPARARPVVWVLLAVAIPLAGVMGTRYEAQAPGARGWAHSGPILGIHPFQITSVSIDGEGPFDLPINDYVEPDGSRGYGPEALAEALQLALVTIAETTYADGPARLRRAFADARVEFVTTPAVWERLDRTPRGETQPRFVVRSGSFGRGSRVEFVCPGRRIDPRGVQGESVMTRMCPDKYASEASAGLGVTGRWSGYSEGRGQARTGLFQLMGTTRSDDDIGRRAQQREVRGWAFILLGLAALLMLRPAASVGQGMRGVAGALGLAAVAGVVVAAVAAGGIFTVGAAPLQPVIGSWSSLVDWAPMLALPGAAIFALDLGSGRGAAHASGSRSATTSVVVSSVAVVVATVALAAALPALSWMFPVGSTGGAQLPTFARGLAEAVGEVGGLTIFEVEGAVAATLVAVALGGLLGVASLGLSITRRIWPGDGHGWVRIGAAVATLAVACALVVSRKTVGGSALVPGVVGMTLVLGSALPWISARRAAGGLSLVAHVGWAALGGALVWAAVDPLPQHPFVTLCTVAGLLAVVAAAVPPLLRQSPRTSSTSPLEHDGSGRL